MWWADRQVKTHHSKPEDELRRPSTQVSSLDLLCHAAERDGAYIIRWKSGKRLDPRLLTLLESFRDVFDKREDFFKKIFPGIYEEFKDVFGKFAMIKGQKREMKTRALERSSSLGSARGLRLERFRVKTPNVTVVTGPQDGGGQVK
nr:Nuclear valosin-containing protein [Ipomoea batatas]GMD59285.1 Nuclear valosin-containing protein [Ipomoea batatas]